MSAAQRPKPGFSFYLSCDINLQESTSSRPTALHVVASISVAQEPFGLDARTVYADSSATGCVWAEWLTFVVKYRDLPHDAQLALNVYEYCEGVPMALVGGTTMPLFNKKGRLKTAPQRLKLWEGRDACVAWPSATPGKRGRLGQLEHLVKLYNRGDIPQVAWLDGHTMEEIQRLQQIESQAVAGRNELQLLVDLPLFPYAVLYQQPISYTAAVQIGGSTAGAGGAASTGGLGPGYGGEGGKGGGVSAEMREAMLGGGSSWERSTGKGLLAGATTSSTQPTERQQMENVIVLLDPERNAAYLTILKLPPNKVLHADEKALIWRFRFSLTQEASLTNPQCVAVAMCWRLNRGVLLPKFLIVVDWSERAWDATQAIELAAAWALIDLSTP
eukprot:gene29143-32361_t